MLNFSDFYISNHHSKQEEPFAMLHPLSEGIELVGNDRYHGYSLDLIKALSELLEFTYDVYEVPDGKHGDLQADGTWSGCIGEVLNGVCILILITQYDQKIRTLVKYNNRNEYVTFLS